MNQQMLDRFNATHKIDLIASVRAHGKVIAVGEGLLPKETYTNQGAVWDDRARALWGHSGFANQVGLLKFALTQAGVTGSRCPSRNRVSTSATTIPTARPGQVFATWDEFDAWRQAHGKRRPGAPRIAVSFFKSTFYSGETELLDALIAEIERQGAEAIPMFGYPGAVAHQQLLLDADGQAARRRRARLPLQLRRHRSLEAAREGRRSGPASGQPLRPQRERVARVESGMSLFEGTFQVAVPELAGTIAPTVVGSKEKSQRSPRPASRSIVNHPIAVARATAVQRARPVRGAAHASRTREKHVALIYYNYPPGKANIGASYLNVAESLANILQRLKQDGYDVGDADLSADSGARRHHDQGAQRRRLRAGRARRDARAGQRRPGAARRLHPLARRILAPGCRRRSSRTGARRRKNRLMAANGGSIVIPVVRYGNVVAAAAAGARLGRGQREDVSRQGSRAASPVRRHLRLAARTGSRPTPSSTSARTARSNGSTARTPACPRKTRPTR